MLNSYAFFNNHAHPNTHSSLIEIGFQPGPPIEAVFEYPNGHAQAEKNENDAGVAYGIVETLPAAFVSSFAALISHGLALAI